jgi:hypothetical protein
MSLAHGCKLLVVIRQAFFQGQKGRRQPIV